MPQKARVADVASVHRERLARAARAAHDFASEVYRAGLKQRATGNGSALASVAYDRAVALRAKRFSGSEHGDCFQQIALSLGVRADESGQARSRFEFEAFVVAKVQQFEMCQLHMQTAARAAVITEMRPGWVTAAGA